MRNDSFYPNLVRKMQEVAVVAPSDVGQFTGVYKIITGHLKQSPWKYGTVAALVASSMAYVLMGAFFLSLVSLIQGAI